MFKIQSLLFLFLLCSVSLSSQGEDRSKLKNKTNETFNIESIKDDNNEKKDEYLKYKNVIKLEFLDFIKDYALVNYTRSTKNNFLNITFVRIHSHYLIKNILDIQPALFIKDIGLKDQFFYPNINSALFSKSNYQVGWMCKLSLKYFYDNDYANDGGYLGFERGQFSRNYSFPFLEPTVSVFSVDYFIPFLKTKTSDFKIYWESREVFGDSNIYYDVSMSTGLGFRKHICAHYNCIDEVNSGKIDLNNPKIITGYT